MNDPAAGPRELQKRAADRTGGTRHQHMRTWTERNLRHCLESRQRRARDRCRRNEWQFCRQRDQGPCRHDRIFSERTRPHIADDGQSSGQSNWNASPSPKAKGTNVPRRVV